jgi:hypothetical protein
VEVVTVKEARKTLLTFNKLYAEASALLDIARCLGDSPLARAAYARAEQKGIEAAALPVEQARTIRYGLYGDAK